MLVSIIAFFLPSLLGVPFRKLSGAKIGHGTKIGIFALVSARTIELGQNSTIKSLSIIKCKSLKLADNAVIKGPSIVKANNVTLDEYANISPLVVISAPLMTGADFTMGKHSQIFPFCWIEPGEGVLIGNQVGVGGHTLIFTHGSWTNHLEGGPVSFGKVIIEDGVWLPWRVFILPGVTIGSNAIVAAHSTVSKSIPARALVGGAPAKVIKEEFVQRPERDERKKRLEKILNEFPEFSRRQSKSYSPSFAVTNEGPLIASGHESVLNFETLSYKTASDTEMIKDLLSFLRRYGIRMSREG